MISVTKLSKSYGTFDAISGISFTVPEKSICGLLGKNGAGKSTTIKILTGSIPPTSGDAILGGHSVVTNPDQVRRLIGYVPENAPLYEDMQLVEYLSFCARLHGLKTNQVKSAVKESLERCSLDKVSTKLCAYLSRGQRQRAAIAQAIVHRPTILVMDEPSTGLDPTQIVSMRALIRELSETATILFSSHIIQEVEALCSHVVVLSDGKVSASGTIGDFTEKGKKLEDSFLSVIPQVSHENAYEATL